MCYFSKPQHQKNQIMRNTLYKAYLDDFAAFCEKLGGTTSEVQGGVCFVCGGG